MKIAYLITRSDNIGGAQVHVRDLALAMRADGHEAWVLTGGEGPFTQSLAARDVPFVSLRHLEAPISPGHDVLAVAELRRVLRRVRPDIVSAHSSKAGVLGRVAARSLGIPTVFTAHGWSFTPGVPRASAAVYRWLERLAAPLAARIITVSDFDRRLAIRERVAAPERLVTIHNGMPDIAPDLQADASGAPVRLATIARFEPQKDHATLLRALAALKELPWTLDLIGDGPLLQRAIQTCEELSLTARVRFWGSLDDVPSVLARAQVYVLISNWEGFPRSILEAMRAGLPVVASRVGGVEEAVEHGASGFLVPRQDPGAVAGALRALLLDPELRRRHGVRGRLLFEQRFTLARTVARTIEVYQAVTESRPRAPASQTGVTSPIGCTE